MADNHENFRCTSCNGSLEFKPGQNSLICPYCGSEQTIANLSQPVLQVEIDFSTARERFASMATEEVRVVHCQSCGGESTLAPNIDAAPCDFCGSKLVVTGPTIKAMKPQYILPFAIGKEDAEKSFRTWISKLWFAPNALKKLASIQDPLKGIYYPFWTFDSQTTSTYTGERGDNYTVQVASTDSQGNKTTRSETRIRWSHVSGVVDRFFDDVLVPASATLPDTLSSKLKNWDLGAMVEANPAVLAGFKAETYSTTLENGFETAKNEMADAIEEDIRHQIGGDHQRIHAVNTRHSEVTFKYIQLPVWTLSYRFKAKYYQVLVNGQNGDIAGARPYSPLKITLAVLLGLAVAAGIVLLINYLNT